VPKPFPSKQRLDALLKAVTKLHLLVVGDVMLDHYVWGDAERLSPEAPVPVVQVEQDTWALGGAANVALNLRGLGAQCELVGSLGEDEAGRRLLGALEAAGIAFDRAQVRADTPTITKSRVMVRGQQLCRLDREAAPQAYPLPPALVQQIQLSPMPLVLSDYAKGVLAQPLIEGLCHSAADRFVALDPKPRTGLRFQGPSLLTPNRKEALALAQITHERHEAFPAEAVCRAIFERYRPQLLVITLGEAGMLLSREGKLCARVPALAREVYDVSGAGDTVVAVLTAALCAGASDHEAALLATAAASCVVSKVGTATATPAQIMDELDHLHTCEQFCS
jgi:D-beta-D-heptose 7-phosphate kinase/D-beta-D-heptose 1-phosphate adenosyltransferase